MRLKKGVRLLGAKPELVIGLMVADSLYRDANTEMVVTSITDSKHSKTSRHYLGLAADLRTRNLKGGTSAPSVMATHLQEELPEFYVALEAAGTPNEHIHMQYNGTPG